MRGRPSWGEATRPTVVKAGLTVYDRDGQRVGYVDDARGEQGWMEVGLAELEFRKLWLPYRIVERTERRGILVAALVFPAPPRSLMATPPDALPRCDESRPIAPAQPTEKG